MGQFHTNMSIRRQKSTRSNKKNTIPLGIHIHKRSHKMTNLWQQDAPLREVREAGCYFLCLARAANIDTWHHLEQYYKWAIRKGFMSELCFIYEPHELVVDKFIVTQWEYDSRYHFTLDNYDPWYGGAETVRKGKIVAYRLIDGFHHETHRISAVSEEAYEATYHDVDVDPSQLPLI